jgi:DhnA family fructose-bisphosphate aldolase class Ia
MAETLNMMHVMAKAGGDGGQERYQLPCAALRDVRIRHHIERMLEAGQGQLKFFPQDHFMEHKHLYMLEEHERGQYYSYMLSAEAAVEGDFSALAILPAAAAAVRAEFPELPLLVKLNASVDDPVDRRQVPTGTIQDAIDVEADAVGLTVYYGSQYLTEMTEHLVEVASECAEFGLPLIVWNYPRGNALDKVEETQIHAQFAGAAHILETTAGRVIPILKMKISEPYKEADWVRGIYAKTKLGKPEAGKPMPECVKRWLNMSRGEVIQKLADYIHRVYGVVSVMSGGEMQDEGGFMKDLADGVGKDRHWGVIVGRSTWGQKTVGAMVKHGDMLSKHLPKVEIG